MKLPALWIALSFACGIAIAAGGAPSLPRVFFAISLAVFTAAAIVSLRFGAMRTAWIFSANSGSWWEFWPPLWNEKPRRWQTNGSRQLDSAFRRKHCAPETASKP